MKAVDPEKNYQVSPPVNGPASWMIQPKERKLKDCLFLLPLSDWG